jgi:hypothetical protein
MCPMFYLRCPKPSRLLLQPSYAQDLGLGDIDHGLYGTLLHGLGGCVGTLGAIPCCPLPNPYQNVQQGSVGLVSRFGKFYKVGPIFPWCLSCAPVHLYPCSPSTLVSSVSMCARRTSSALTSRSKSAPLAARKLLLVIMSTLRCACR